MNKNKNIWKSMREIDSDKLSDLIFREGYTLSGLSTKIGAGDTYLSQKLRDGKISAKYLTPLCRALHASPSDFVKENDDLGTEPIEITGKVKLDQLELQLEEEDPLDVMLHKIDDAILEYLNSKID